jgi:cell volume regulation protein A
MKIPVLLIIAVILLFMVFVARLSTRLNIPLIIIALTIGIIFGSDVTGLIYFDDAIFARDVANIALIFILFAGGFGTKSNHFRSVAKPAMLLATGGVLITALITASLFSFVTGWPFLKSLLVSAIISSTDAAAVFSILRSRSINKNVASITEVESAANDPMAIISTTFILQIILGAGIDTTVSMVLFIWQLAGGVAFGILTGIVGTYLFNKIRNIDIGYYYVFLIGIILLSFSIADLSKASGMLSAFFTGYVLGNRKLPFKSGITSFTEMLSFISNVGLFIMLGLLVFPHKFSDIWITAIIIFLILTFIARPVAVLICTAFCGLKLREKLFISWGGLRGAVPIVLATYPAAAGIDNEHQIFNIVFFAVTLSIMIQGTTIGRLADIFNLTSKSRMKPGQTMELVTIHDTDYELIHIFIDPDMYMGELTISEMELPPGVTITMVNRNNTVIAPRGSTVIYPGDVLSILVSREKIKKVTKQVLGYFTAIR